MDRIESRLRELHQELIEARNLSIKTDHTVRNLAAEINELSKVQKEFHRKAIWNSAGAYILFTLLVIGAAALIVKATVQARGGDEDLLRDRVEQLETRVHELEDEVARKRASEKEAWNFYELLEKGSAEEAVERFPSIQGELSDRASVELFRREVDRIRHQLASDTFAEGMRAYNLKNWAEARNAFERSLNYRDFAPYTPELQFHLGDALFHLKEFTLALRSYNSALASGQLSRDLQPQAAFRVAESLRQLGRSREALEAYKTFQQNFPYHSWASSAEKRAASLQQSIE